jgi:uncharacterized protein YdaU (DUF1376 family)
MPMFWGDYARDTGHLNAAGHGAYLMLIKHYWCTGQPLNDDDDELWRIACCDSKKEWQALRGKIVRLFQVEGNLLRHKRIDKEIERAKAVVSAKAEAGRKGAERRWQTDGDAIAQPSSANSNGMVAPEESHQFANAPSPSPSPSEGRKNLSIASQSPSTRVEDEFDQFWDAYPRKVGKEEARKAFARALKKTDVGVILGAVQQQHWSDDPKYRPHPSTWLNRGSWSDEVGRDPTLEALNLTDDDVEDFFATQGRPH